MPENHNHYLRPLEFHSGICLRDHIFVCSAAAARRPIVRFLSGKYLMI
jgi:hypothetical protein